MEQTRKHFTQDYLLEEVRDSFRKGLKREHLEDSKKAEFSNLDCLMAGLSVFTFKYPSLLQFDHDRREKKTLIQNLKNLFKIKNVPCDTQMRARLDTLSPDISRPPFQRLFTLLQRAKVLEHFKFIDGNYLISLDGTGIFSSSTIHCQNCCVKEHRNGTKTYYHQVLGAALVHPDQSVVFPFAAEPIIKSDGQEKNDCERNAAKRWLKDFRREHPHLQATVVADGLSSNAPFILELLKNHLNFILVAKEADHKFLFDWFNSAGQEDAPCFESKEKQVLKTYQYMNNVPLNDSNFDVRVNVVRYTATENSITRTWVWVTNLSVSPKNIKDIVKGGLARWKIENETFNTLKNQGYQFERNFGHGDKNLSTIFAQLMLLAFFIDQCLQHLNKRFQQARVKSGSLRSLWNTMLSFIYLLEIPNFETLYETLIDPPVFKINAVSR